MSDRNKIKFFFIIWAFSVYAFLFILFTSFIIDGELYFSLFDDAMVSMRYAKNLVAGHGLVWNPGGERVEGFTNPLWVLIMAMIHLFPVPPSKVSLIIQMLAALILVIHLFVIKKVAEFISNGSPFVVLGSTLLTAFYLPLNNWSLQGMEVSLLTLIISLSCLNALKCLNEQSSPMWLYTLLGIGTLVRLDMVVIFLGILIFFLLFDVHKRKRHAYYGIIILSLCIIPQTLLRIWYYNDILPNTYYLKMTGFPFIFRISKGIIVFIDFLCHLNVLFFLALLGVCFLIRDKSTRLLAWVFLMQVLYHIYVGGDAWEKLGWGSRYLVVVMPLFFLLLCNGIYRLDIPKFLENAGKKVNDRQIKLFSILFFIFSLMNLNMIKGSLFYFLLLKRPLHIEDNAVMVKQSLLLGEVTEKGAKIAVVWAGIIPYFADRTFIDLLGKNDKKIALIKMRIADGIGKVFCFYPGHLKWDYNYSIVNMKPDIVMQLWEGRVLESSKDLQINNVFRQDSDLEAYKFLRKEYRELKPRIIGLQSSWWLHRGSTQLIWDNIICFSNDLSSGDG